MFREHNRIRCLALRRSAITVGGGARFVIAQVRAYRAWLCTALCPSLKFDSMAPCKMPHSIPASFTMAIILAAMVWWTEGAALIPAMIPESFTTKDLSAFTIRYLSMDGRDTDACLSSDQNLQVNTTIINNTIQSCGSLSYALTGGNSTPLENLNLMVLALPGVYLLGNRGVNILHYQDIILSKMPDTSGEVIFKCNEFLEAQYNNLYFFHTTNVTLNEIVFTACGSFISPVNIQQAANVNISKCVFR